jgi:DNA-binding transcriptional MerR regulator
MFLTTNAVALRLGLTPYAVRWHERQGHLESIKVQRSPTSYQRLYFEENVERFRQKRAAKALAQQACVDVLDAAVVP